MMKESVFWIIFFAVYIFILFKESNRLKRALIVVTAQLFILVVSILYR